MPKAGDVPGLSDVALAVPTARKNHLVTIANTLLPPNTGTRYRDVVVNCLTYLEEDNADFVDGSDFEDEDGIVVGVRYIEKVSLPRKGMVTFSLTCNRFCYN